MAPRRQIFLNPLNTLLPAMKHIALVALTSLITTAASVAQGTSPAAGSSDTEGKAEPIKTKFWKASLPGGDYMVALGRISSIAKHTYVSDGAARVFEVTIADASSAIARFYYIEPVTDKSPLNVGQVVIDRARGVAKEATKRTGRDDVWSEVVKNYPTSTHAKTMEYRLPTKTNIDSIYGSVSRAWESGRGERFVLRNQSD